MMWFEFDHPLRGEFILKRYVKNIFVFAAFCISIISPATLLAHREDYIDETLVFETLEKQALETEYWLDLGNENGSSLGFVRHNASFEYGVTDHWMVDARGTLPAQWASDVFD